MKDLNGMATIAIIAAHERDGKANKIWDRSKIKKKEREQVRVRRKIKSMKKYERKITPYDISVSM